MSLLDSILKGSETVTKLAGGAALTAAGVPPPLAKVAATAANPTKILYKGIKTAQNWLGKIVGRKKNKAEKRLEQEKQKIAQLEALQTGGTRSGSDYPTSDLQKKVFGIAPDESKKILGRTIPIPSALLAKFDSKNNKTGKQMEQAKDWFGKNWMYVVGGLAAYYFLIGKKRR